MASTLDKRLNRLYVPQAKALGQQVDLPEEALHYLSRVLRIVDQGLIVAWNGQGQDFVAQVHYLSKRDVCLKIIEGPLNRASSELACPVYVGQGLPEGDKMDWVLEKCTEMGAAGFYPIQAQRSVVRLKAERAEKRHLHWERVLQSAGCQSERAMVPFLNPTSDLQEAIDTFRQSHPHGQVLLFTPQADLALNDWAKQPNQIDTSPSALCILVGPEGGWSPEELALAQGKQVTCLRFSNRILRTETFGLACLSQLISLFQLEVMQ